MRAHSRGPGSSTPPRPGADQEWPSGLDIPALLAGGWEPVPFREFVLKIHSRCDLACDYCYMYEMADQGWRHQPARMAPGIVDATAARIAEHAAAYHLDSVHVILHGGEPLLAGPEITRHAVTAVRRAVPPGTRARFSVQTNAFRLDDGWLRLFADLDVGIGVSLDGDAAGHDRHRRRRTGQGSHAAVSEALERLTSAPFRHLFSGLLCTIDLRNDPLATYRALLAHQPPTVDFLLPHGNWTAPPPGRPADFSAPYAAWLGPVFDAWYHAPGLPTRVRLFSEIMQLLLGGASRTEAVGLSPVAMLVIETNGSIEGGDALKSAFPGAPATGLHVTRDPFDRALLLPPVAARQLGARALCATCLACPVHRVCGGGHYAHRYAAGTGFANPSVYCRDLYLLIAHIRQVMEADLARRAVPRP
jgi:uncharacterized protein